MRDVSHLDRRATLPPPMPAQLPCNARALIDLQARQNIRETVDRHLLRAESDLYMLVRVDGDRGYLKIVRTLVHARSLLDAIEGADFKEGA